jgi:membrane protein involved in colicin uptake
MQEQQEQQRRAEEANRRYAADLAARAEAKRRANSLIGKVGKLFNQ